MMTLFSKWTIERKYRFLVYLSILIPIGGFLLIPFLEASSSSPSYNGIIPGWQNTVISIYALIMVINWVLTSIYYSKFETSQTQVIKKGYK